MFTDKTERPYELFQTVRGRKQSDDDQRRCRRRFTKVRCRKCQFRFGRGTGHPVGRSETFGIPVSVHVRVTGVSAENHGLQAARVHQVRDLDTHFIRLPDLVSS